MMQTHLSISEIEQLDYWKFEAFIERLNKRNADSKKQQDKQNEEMKKMQASQNRTARIPKYKMPKYK